MNVRREFRNLIRVTRFEGKLMYFRIYDRLCCLLMELLRMRLSPTQRCVTSLPRFEHNYYTNYATAFP